ESMPSAKEQPGPSVLEFPPPAVTVPEVLEQVPLARAKWGSSTRLSAELPEAIRNRPEPLFAPQTWRPTGLVPLNAPEPALRGVMPDPKVFQAGGWGITQLLGLRPPGAPAPAMTEQSTDVGLDSGLAGIIDQWGLDASLLPQIAGKLHTLVPGFSAGDTPDVTRAADLWRGVDLRLEVDGQPKILTFALEPLPGDNPLGRQEFHKTAIEVPDIADPRLQHQSWFDMDQNLVNAKSRATSSTTTLGLGVSTQIGPVSPGLGLSTSYTRTESSGDHHRINRSTVTSIRPTSWAAFIGQANLIGSIRDAPVDSAGRLTALSHLSPLPKPAGPITYGVEPVEVLYRVPVSSTVTLPVFGP
ncbi:MAG: hypothetical protein ACRC0L_01475, partial [Angustibacter sp.]